MLNQEQQAAMNAIEEFLQSNKIICVLDAPAGTGKTYLINHLAHKYPRKFYIAATTHKAAEVLSNVLNDNVKTVHAMFKIRVKSNYNNGKEELDFSNAKSLSGWFIIDECSMIDQELFAALLKLAPKSKFIFVGDRCQLAPVKCSLSPVFEYADVTLSLTKIMRTDGNKSIEDICKRYRSVVETKEFPQTKATGDVIVLNPPEFMAKINEHFAVPSFDSKILCYTNQRVMEFVSYIDHHLRHKDQLLRVGENYLVNSAVLNKDDEVIIPNNTEVTLERLGELHQGDYMSYYDVTLRLHDRDVTIDTFVPFNEHYKATAMKEAAKQKDWKHYFMMKNGWADLRSRDCSTVHKAQGMTIDNVFIDLENLGSCRSHSTFARLLYVALSRARKKIYLCGALPERYGCII